MPSANAGKESTSSTGNRKDTGLRARKKAACYQKILSSARKLFQSPGFDKTTMAAIAEASEVSTPTVFNYFKTKDELLLALVLEVHQETRAAVKGFRAPDATGPADAICEFLGMYSAMSLQALSRQTWRHVESTCIRLPDSDFVRRYDVYTREMLEDLVDFLSEPGPQSFGGDAHTEKVATILFNHWGRLFIDMARDETITLEQHVKQLREDLDALFSLAAS